VFMSESVEKTFTLKGLKLVITEQEDATREKPRTVKRSRYRSRHSNKIFFYIMNIGLT